MSTPHNEGNIPRGEDSGNKMLEIDMNFQSVLSKEKINTEEEFNKPNNISMINKSNKKDNNNNNTTTTASISNNNDKPKGVKMIGKVSI